MSKKLLTLLALCSATSLLQAAVTLGLSYTDNAVLQREMPLPIRGTAEPGEMVTVRFAGQVVETTANDKGEWTATLSPLPASFEKRTLSATAASGTAESHNILVGEVWLCSGQSNMHLPLWGTIPTFRDYTPEDPEAGLHAAEKADDSDLRILYIPQMISHIPDDKLTADLKWQETTRDSIMPFSAVAYFFGQRLRDELQIPIGLIGSYWGGSSCEAFTAPEGFDAIPELADIATNVNAKLPGHPKWQKAIDELEKTYTDYLADLKKASESLLPLPVPPEPPFKIRPFTSDQHPAMKYNAMIYPLRGTAMRGAIWYQGESNLTQGEEYFLYLDALYKGWQTVFQNPEFSLYIAQLAPFNYGANNTYLPRLWAAQEKFAATYAPYTAMAVINDVGNLNDIHPGDKKTVGCRLADLALVRQYGFTDRQAEMPILDTAENAGSAMKLNFRNVNAWHTIDGGPVKHFQISGLDGLFYPATVQADGPTLIVSAPQVTRAYAVRYMWDPLSEASLIADSGLPLGAFRYGNEKSWQDALDNYTKDATLVFEADLKNGYRDNRMNYKTDNAANVGKFSRVIYQIVAEKKLDEYQYLQIETEAFTDNPAALGVPNVFDNISLQKRIGKMQISTNIPELPSGNTEGAIEFFCHNYGTNPKGDWDKADPNRYDINDAEANEGNYGCMQFHDLITKTTVFSYGNFKDGAEADFGFGPAPEGLQPDWTFSRNLGNYRNVQLKIYVR